VLATLLLQSGKNRDRLLEGDTGANGCLKKSTTASCFVSSSMPSPIAAAFFDAQAGQAGLLSDEHFTVDGKPRGKLPRVRSPEWQAKNETDRF
jgi:hypothetical protein